MRKQRLLAWAGALAVCWMLTGCIIAPPHGHDHGHYDGGRRPPPGLRY